MKFEYMENFPRFTSNSQGIDSEPYFWTIIISPTKRTDSNSDSVMFLLLENQIAGTQFIEFTEVKAWK